MLRSLHRSFAALAIFTLPVSLFAAEPPSVERARNLFHQMAKVRLDTELVHMQLAMDISDDQTQLLRDAGVEAIKEWTKQTSPEVWFAAKKLPEPVIDAVLKKADRRLGSVVTNRYRKDTQIEAKLHRTIGVNGFAVILDQVLALNQKQNEQIRKLVASKWQAKWLNRVLTSGSERINILRPALADFKPQLSRILTRQQLRVLQTRHPSSSRALMKNMEPSEIAAATAKFRKSSAAQVADTMAVRVDELVELCALNAQQQKDLQSTAQQITTDLTESLADAFEELKRKGPGAAAPQAWELISSNHFLLIEQSPEWQSALQRTLSPQQQEAWQRRQSQRRKQWRASTIGGIGALIGQQIKFTAKQTSDFIDVLEQEIDINKAFSTNEHYRELAQIPDKKFDGLFSDEQRIALSSVISDYRKLK